MKPQDIIFIVVLLILLWKHNPKLTVTAGLLSLLFSIPLFVLQIFFTAQRLVMYASAFLLLSIILTIYYSRGK